MKIYGLVVFGMVATVVGTLGTRAQTANQSSTNSLVPAPTAYHIVERGASHRVWQRETYEKTVQGKIITHVHKYTELSTGMYYKDAQGQWTESQELIEPGQNGAAARHGRHQVAFDNNLNSRGSVALQMPDGKKLDINVLGLAYYDHSSDNTVMLGQIQDSQGELISSNQVLYPNAFSGVDADVRYTYRRGGFEQDVILREQPPDPQTLGLNPDTTELEVMTEFLNPPHETIKDHSKFKHPRLDQDISWGSMALGHGKAFDLGDQRPYWDGTSVSKQYVTVNGRKVLLEMVPWKNVRAKISGLPKQASIQKAKPFLMAKTLALPKTPAPKTAQRPLRLAPATPPKQGYVLDYYMFTADTNDFTFQSDTTYLLDGGVNFSGTTIFEGGTVIKYSADDPGVLQLWGPAVCKSSEYRPIVMTSQNDNAVGEYISNSGPLFVLNEFSMNAGDSDVVMEHLRCSYADVGVHPTCPNFRLTDAQFVNCGRPFCPENVDCQLNNILIANCTNVFWGGEYTVNASHFTVDGCEAQFTDGWDDSSDDNITFTNSLLININSFGYANLATDHTVQLSSDAGVFQTAGGGGYYLATNSPYRGAGTANIDPGFLADIGDKTTYPPVVALVITNATTLSPQAPRDTNGVPDLGYHYDPLDYIFGGCLLDTNLTLTSGTAVAWYDYDGAPNLSIYTPFGFLLGYQSTNGVVFTSTGTATQPCWIVQYNTVQENGVWANQGQVNGVLFGATGRPEHINTTFTKWSALAGMDGFIGALTATSNSAVNCLDNEFYGGSGGVGLVAPQFFTNCLFVRSSINYSDVSGGGSGAWNVALQDCTFYGGSISLTRYLTNSPSLWTIKNTAFDGTAFIISDPSVGSTNHTTFDYNAYNSADTSWQGFPSANGTFETSGPHDVTVTNGYNWQSSWFGDYYLPPDSPLVNAGSTTADRVGFYHFTTQTNQVPETNSIVDIGYHYVATDQYGNPLDSNGDGIPDYLQDTNGNGSGPWMPVPVITVQPVSQGVGLGSNVTFSVSAASLVVPSYQWYFNGSLLVGATNASLTLANVQMTNGGNYVVTVVNPAGSATSTIATLTVLFSPVILLQPTNQSAALGDDVFFTMAASAVPAPSYQWYFDGVAIAGATNATLELDGVETNNVGNYKVTVWNLCGSTNSQTVLLTNLTAPWGYVVVRGTLTNYVFQGDTTYYVNSMVQLMGMTTLEGGTVIKFGNHATSQLNLNGPLNCLTATYRPALLTSRDDNTAGWAIRQSNGSPTNYYRASYLVDGGSQTNAYHNLRIKYAGTAIVGANPVDVWDTQFIYCGTAVSNAIGGAVGLHNVLISATANCAVTAGSVGAEFLTADQCQNFCLGSYADAALTNSILTAFANTNGIHLVSSVCLSSGTGVYQTAGGGGYYLAAHAYQQAGMANVSPVVLADIAGKTTWPPIVYHIPGVYYSTNLNLAPQAFRDASLTPDLGYHYDPLDYVMGSMWVTNASIIVNAGTAIGIYCTNRVYYGLAINNNASLSIVGLANNLAHIVEYNTVQEQNPFGWQMPGDGNISQFDGANYQISCRFVDWSCMAQDVPHFWFDGFSPGLSATFQNCQFHGGTATTWWQALDFTNCLLERVNCDFEPGDTNIPVFCNNTIFGGTFGFSPWTATNAVVVNNLFDSANIPDELAGWGWPYYVGSHNVYVTNYPTLDPISPTDIIIANSPAYQSSWFGNYYLPPGSPLINAGSITADQVGLYHFTTQTNQVPETNSIIDIGYHYVATDQNGNPLDSNGDGIPDYLQDTNGNGSGPWMPAPVITVQPVSQYAIVNSNAVLTVVVAGLAPVSCQWYFNGSLLNGATNASLNLANVQLTNGGNYSVIVANPAGVASSSNAILSVMTWTNDADYDGRSDAQEILDGTDPHDPNNVLFVQLASWSFLNTNTFIGDEGQMPLIVTNVAGAYTTNGNVIVIASTNPAVLCYRDIETNGNANINLRNGAISFWFNPDWTSTSLGGTGPGVPGRLLELGANSSLTASGTNAAPYTNGWWSLFFNSSGTQLCFGSSTNGAGQINLAANIDWNSNSWHQIMLEYTPTNSLLILDGLLATNGAGPVYYPNLSERSRGFTIGSDASGSNQAAGSFSGLVTYNYALNSGAIPTNPPPEPRIPTGFGGCSLSFSYTELNDPTLQVTANVPEPGLVSETINVSVTMSQGIMGSCEIIDDNFENICYYDRDSGTAVPWQYTAAWVSWITSYEDSDTPSGLGDIDNLTVNTPPRGQYSPLVASGVISYATGAAGGEVFSIMQGYGTEGPPLPTQEYKTFFSPQWNVPISVLPPTRLTYLSFNGGALNGSLGQLPMAANNLSFVPSPFGGGIKFDSTQSVELKYSAFQNDAFSVSELDGSLQKSTGTPNVRRNEGTIRFWYSPDWSTGSGPAAGGIFLDMVSAGWTLEVVDNGGTTIQLNTSYGSSSTVLSRPVTFTAGKWYQIAIVYSSSQTILYINGVQVGTMGSGIMTTLPNVLTTFRIGSDGGSRQVRGIMDEVETFNYALAVKDINTAYLTAATADSDGDGIPDIIEFENGTDPSNPPGGVDNPPAPSGPDSGLPVIQVIEPIYSN